MERTVHHAIHGQRGFKITKMQCGSSPQIKKIGSAAIPKTRTIQSPKRSTAEILKRL